MLLYLWFSPQMHTFFTTLNPLRENLVLFISHCPISTSWINEHHFSHHTNEDRKMNHLIVSGFRQYLNIISKKQHQFRNHWKDWCWSWSSNTLATWCEELTHWKRPWCWERLKVGEGDGRGWDGWMASLTRWMWVWASFGSCWWTGRPGVLQSVGSQRVGRNWATELNWSPHTS